MEGKKMGRKALVVVGVLGAMVLGGGLAQAKQNAFTVTIPVAGSTTYGDQMTTNSTNPNPKGAGEIGIQYSSNPHNTDVKPVRCSDLSDISGQKSIAGGDHSYKTLASNVRSGTCFRLNFDSSYILGSFSVSGKAYF